MKILQRFEEIFVKIGQFPRNAAKNHGKTNENVNWVMKIEMRSSRLLNLKNLTKISVDSCKNDVYVFTLKSAQKSSAVLCKGI